MGLWHTALVACVCTYTATITLPPDLALQKLSYKTMLML